jgi:nucleoside-diphosphate-sugar epimerase
MTRLANPAVATAVSDDPIKDVADLEERLSEPTPGLIDTFRRLKGDIVVLGVGGKMGPTLAKMAQKASLAVGGSRRVIGVSRFGSSSTNLKQRLESWGIQTISADILDRKALEKLPDAPNVVYMAGMKFGSTGAEAMTWAMNSYLPGMVCERYRTSKIVAFSTGNIYGLQPITRGGSLETDPLDPKGDYAMSCLGRERMFEHFGRALNIPVALIRLNYATEMRYGVLFDVATKVWAGETVDITMGNFNAIWQGDANAMSLQAFDHVSSPPFVINVAGPEILSIRRLAEHFGVLMKKPVKVEGTEAGDALTSNGQLCHRLYGYPRVSIQQVMRWTADWVMRGGESLGKPTHFEARDGKF